MGAGTGTGDMMMKRRGESGGYYAMLYLLLTTYYSLTLVGVGHPPPLRNLCKSSLLSSPICGWIRERERGGERAREQFEMHLV